MLCSSESNLAVAQRELAMLLININFEPAARTDDLKSFAQQATVMAVDTISRHTRIEPRRLSVQFESLAGISGRTCLSHMSQADWRPLGGSQYRNGCR
jgi:hypothetical protein